MVPAVENAPYEVAVSMRVQDVFHTVERDALVHEQRESAHSQIGVGDHSQDKIKGYQEQRHK